jgi:hypothetical protein
MNRLLLSKIVLGISLLGTLGATLAQVSPSQYQDCSPEALLFALRNLEDQIALASASPVVRTDYALDVTDPGVDSKVYRLYRCEVLQDSIVALEARLNVLLGVTPPPAFNCGTSTVRFDGHDYTTAQIGSQCWFAENLRNQHYRNGDWMSQPGNRPPQERPLFMMRVVRMQVRIWPFMVGCTIGLQFLMLAAFVQRGGTCRRMRSGPC